ncbi:MAG: hypothetical protein JWN24_1774 [Phycisphaerales bacterium]|nr:hypothetical protein [Phycisphaerales bacterium]
MGDQINSSGRTVEATDEPSPTASSSQNGKKAPKTLADKIQSLPASSRAPKGVKPRKKNKAAKADLRRRGRKPYPVMTFEEALAIGQGILEHGAGHPMRRNTLLEKLKLFNNQPTKNLITASSKYGITSGSHDADEIRLTPAGADAVSPKPTVKRYQARFELALKSVPHFFKLYDRFKGGKMPATEVMRDALDDLDAGDRPQCVDIFIANAKTVGILQVKEGAGFLLTLEELLEQAPASGNATRTVPESDETPANGVGSDAEEFDKVCFFIAPIGADDSEHRHHSDAILSSFVEHALAEHGLKVIRADKISKPGMISAQIIEYVLKSKLVVADLSFHNPNVFYELCLRHVTGKPTVHLIREADRIPFDVGNFRTIPIKMDSVYGILAKLDTYRAEIAQQIRQVLADGVSTNNPILTYCPKGRFVVEGEA